MCKVINCKNTELVESGIDALMLGGIPTGQFCYTCAAAYLQLSHAVSSLNEVAHA